LPCVAMPATKDLRGICMRLNEQWHKPLIHAMQHRATTAIATPQW